jgi:hypothetical protein
MLVAIGGVAHAGGLWWKTVRASYDPQTGAIAVCGDIDRYRASRDLGFVFAVTVGDEEVGAKTALYASMAAESDRLCVTMLFRLDLHDRIVVHVFKDPLSRGPGGVGTDAVPITKLSDATQREAAKIAQTSKETRAVIDQDYDSTVLIYLKLNGKVPGSEINPQPGVGSRPLTFTWSTHGDLKGRTPTFRYRLFPAEMDWSNWGAETSATYTSMPAGIFELEVEGRLTDGHGETLLETSTYSFTLQQAFIGPAVKKSVTGGAHFASDPYVASARRRALLVGVTVYANSTQFRPLSFVANDLKGFESALMKVGFATRDIQTLKNTRLTSQEIRAEISKFIAAAADGEQTIIYLSGHGFIPVDSSEGRAYFAGTDCSQTDTSTCVSLEDVKSELVDAVGRANNAPRHVLLVVDACAAGDLVVAKGTGTLEISAARERSVEVITAGTRSEDALEDPGTQMSVFTRYLADGLSGSADVVQDRVISVPRLMSWVSYQVAKATAGQQTPSHLRVKGAGTMFFVEN